MKRPIAFLVETGSRAGGVRVIGEMANRLADRDWTVSIWSPNPKETMSWFPLSHKVKWHSFFKTGMAIDYQQLADVLRKQDCIKIATFWRTAVVLNECFKEGEGYYLVQDLEQSYTSQPVFTNLVASTYEFPFQKFTTSKWVQGKLPDTEYVGIGLSNIYRPPNKGLRRGNYVLACERIQALKGWSTFCEVSRYLRQMGIPVMTYGADEEVPIMVPVEHKRNPTDEQVRRMLQECGIFLSQSKHEGFNLTLLEAMACGTPCVTTNSDGNMEYAEDGVNCLLTNDPPQLAIGCYRIFKEPDLAKKFMENGPKTSERYRWPPVIDRLEAVLSK